MKKYLAFAALVITTCAQADTTIYRCQVNGKTLYSESPCGTNTTKRMDVDTSQRIGNVVPDKETIEMTRWKIQNEIRQEQADGGKAFTTGATPLRGPTTTTTSTSTTTTVRTGSDKPAVCGNLTRQLKEINEAARRPQSAFYQDQLRERKIDIQRKYFEWQC